MALEQLGNKVVLKTKLCQEKIAQSQAITTNDSASIPDLLGKVCDTDPGAVVVSPAFGMLPKVLVLNIEKEPTYCSFFFF